MLSNYIAIQNFLVNFDHTDTSCVIFPMYVTRAIKFYERTQRKLLLRSSARHFRHMLIFLLEAISSCEVNENKSYENYKTSRYIFIISSSVYLFQVHHLFMIYTHIYIVYTYVVDICIVMHYEICNKLLFRY